MSEMKWIPFITRSVTYDIDGNSPHVWQLQEPLPEDGQEILVTIDCPGHQQTQTDIFVDNGCECYLESGYEIEDEATAWMPLPEPYKKEGKR